MQREKNSEKIPSPRQELNSLLGCVASRCGSSQDPEIDPCSPQSLQQLSGQSIRLDHGGSWVQFLPGARNFFRVFFSLHLHLIFYLQILVFILISSTNFLMFYDFRNSGSIGKVKHNLTNRNKIKKKLDKKKRKC